ncbi:MAG TPA: glycosyltransferase [Candidatus Omnitrophica bacterium]|nr:glycosyltransferase [Candidatus Omnitrophota bacterium]
MSNKHEVKVGVISTYPPEKCGIANYCYSAIQHLKKYQTLKFHLYPIETRPLQYSEKVIYSIKRGEVESYLEAARTINRDDIDLVLMQHQFLLYGENGTITPLFLEVIKKPLICVVHTVPSCPLRGEEEALRSIGQKAKKIVVMTYYAKKLLQERFSYPSNKIEVIYHPYPPFIRLDREKAKMKLKIPPDYTVLSTFGLLRREKGIEVAIEALRFLKDEKIIYFIIGETHPEHHQKEGDTYRKELARIAEKMNVEGMLRWVGHFLTTEELNLYMCATDFYLAPYHTRQQASSGSLTYALGVGRIVLSTPFPFAREMLDGEKGVIVDYNSPEEIAKKIKALMYNPKKRREIERKVEELADEISWDRAAVKYRQILTEYSSEEKDE